MINQNIKISLFKPSRPTFFADDSKKSGGSGNESKRDEPLGQWKMMAEEMEGFETIPHARDIVKM